MIKIPDNLKDKKLSQIVLHNVFDNVNLRGDIWSIILREDKIEIVEVPKREEETRFLRLHNFNCDMKNVHFAVIIATSWLYDNKISFDTIIIHTSDNIV